MARAQAEVVVVSIFVNPLQFGPGEDYGRYPRDPARDRKLLEAERVDLLFAPEAERMYPSGAATYVTVEGMSERLCGRFRPEHFRGVATVVTKLLLIVEPDMVFLGQKDAAQAAILRRMIRDLNFGVEMVVAPTVREADGLAMSSRNAYLEPQQRKSAAVLYRCLMRIQTLADKGERSAAALVQAGRQVLSEEPSLRLEYLEVVDSDTLEPVPDISQGALVAIAAHMGTTRLIDNIVLHGAGTAAGPGLAQ
jgi:pantoate--beta-alanine ligase